MFPRRLNCYALFGDPLSRNKSFPPWPIRGPSHTPDRLRFSSCPSPVIARMRREANGRAARCGLMQDPENHGWKLSQRFRSASESHPRSLQGIKLALRPLYDLRRLHTGRRLLGGMSRHCVTQPNFPASWCQAAGIVSLP